MLEKNVKFYEVLVRNQSIQTCSCRMHSMQLYGIYIKYIFVYLSTNNLSQMFSRFEFFFLVQVENLLKLYLFIIVLYYLVIFSNRFFIFIF